MKCRIKSKESKRKRENKEILEINTLEDKLINNTSGQYRHILEQIKMDRRDFF
jgi:hypothetical protein